MFVKRKNSSPYVNLKKEEYVCFFLGFYAIRSK